eukprot:6014289-Alexandrium_andersonii.AAC.1
MPANTYNEFIRLLRNPLKLGTKLTSYFMRNQATPPNHTYDSQSTRAWDWQKYWFNATVKGEEN